MCTCISETDKSGRCLDCGELQKPKELVSVVKREQGGYSVTYYNGADMGTFEYGIDGYLYYWPSKREGCWSAPLMREIANLLDHLNAPWDKQVQGGVG